MTAYLLKIKPFSLCMSTLNLLNIKNVLPYPSHQFSVIFFPFFSTLQPLLPVHLLSRAAEDKFSNGLFLFSATLHGTVVLSHPHSVSFFLSVSHSSALSCVLPTLPPPSGSFSCPPLFSAALNINELIGGSCLSPMSVDGLPSWHGSAVVVSKPLKAQTWNAASCSSQQHLCSWWVVNWGVSSRREVGETVEKCSIEKALAAADKVSGWGGGGV